MDESKKKPTLTDALDRLWYLESPDNWDDIEKSKLTSKGGQPIFKIQRLKGTDIMKLLVYKGESQMIPGGYDDFYTFKLDKNGNFKYCDSIEIGVRLKELGI